jgi:NDP-sugar pyrophosphorylase family protein
MTLTRPDDLLALSRYYLVHDPTCAAVVSPVPASAVLVPPVRIEENVQVGKGCIIGPEVTLEASCRVGPGALVRRTVVCRGGLIEAGTLVDGEVIVPRSAG